MKTAEEHINEYVESKKEYIIPICEFSSHGVKGNPITKVNVIKLNGSYYYQTYYGNKSTRYNSIEQARIEIQNMYGKYQGFKFL